MCTTGQGAKHMQDLHHLPDANLQTARTVRGSGHHQVLLVAHQAVVLLVLAAVAVVAVQVGRQGPVLVTHHPAAQVRDESCDTAAVLCFVFLAHAAHQSLV